MALRYLERYITAGLENTGMDVGIMVVPIKYNFSEAFKHETVLPIECFSTGGYSTHFLVLKHTLLVKKWVSKMCLIMLVDRHLPTI
jgi:hypothetical protein